MSIAKILIVEDNPSFQTLWRLRLEPHAQVVIAGSIAAGMRMIREAESPFTHAILDGRVPLYDDEPLRHNSTTIELARHIDSVLRIPMFSASSSNELNDQLVSAGCIRATKETVMNLVLSVLGVKGK